MSIETAITGVGIAVGARRVTNTELAEKVNSSDEWIRKRTGIESRYFVEEGQSGAEMARVASLAALDEAGLAPEDIDAIVFATLTPDVAFPGTGVYLQKALGLAPIPALDVRNQCSGFLYGLSVAHAWIAAGLYGRVLLVGSEIHSTGLNLSPEGRDVAVLFGDGAGAAVVEGRAPARSDENRAGQVGRLLDLRLGADGRGAELLICERPGSQFHPRVSADDLESGRHFPTMEGRQVFRRAVEVLTSEIEAIVKANDIDLDRVVLVPHQSNQRINELVAERVGVAEDRVVHTIKEYGNTTAASIPMALHHAQDAGMIRDGDVVILAAFGSGLTWGTAALAY